MKRKFIWVDSHSNSSRIPATNIIDAINYCKAKVGDTLNFDGGLYKSCEVSFDGSGHFEHLDLSDQLNDDGTVKWAKRSQIPE